VITDQASTGDQITTRPDLSGAPLQGHRGPTTGLKGVGVCRPPKSGKTSHFQRFREPRNTSGGHGVPHIALDRLTSGDFNNPIHSAIHTPGRR
jgi:hypothetical protein